MAFREAQTSGIVAKYIRTESVTATQRYLHSTMHKTLLSRNTVLRCLTRILEAGIMEHMGGNGRPRVSDRKVEGMRFLFETNPHLSIRQAESLLNISRSTITRNFTQLFAVIPIQDAKATWNHELGHDETDDLGAALPKSTKRND